MTANQLIRVIKRGLGQLNSWDIDIKINGKSIKDAVIMMDLDDPNPDSVNLIISERDENNLLD